MPSIATCGYPTYDGYPRHIRSRGHTFATRHSAQATRNTTSAEVARRPWPHPRLLAGDGIGRGAVKVERSSNARKGLETLSRPGYFPLHASEATRPADKG